jgi:HNH endonuclease.
MDDRRVCPSCKSELALSEFYKEKTNRFGIRAYCKKCTKEKFHKYYELNKEKIYKKTREYIASHLSQHKASQLRYRELNRDRINKKSSEKRIGTDRSKEKLARRSRENKRLFLFTEQDWKDVVLEFGGRCAYCCKKAKLTKDHYIPLSHPSGDTIPGNIVPACLSCNSSKIDKSPMYWVEEKFGVDRLDEIQEILTRVRNKHYDRVIDAQFNHLGIERPIFG